MLAPLLILARAVWPLIGRPGAVGRILFWAALEQEDFALAGAVLKRLDADAQPDSDWTRRARLMLENRRPVDPDGLRGLLGPAPIPAPAPPGAPLAYVLAGSLPLMRQGYALRSQALAQALVAAGQPLTCLTRPGFPQDWPGYRGSDQDGNRGAAPPETSCVDAIAYRHLPEPRQDRLGLEAWLTSAGTVLARELAAHSPAVVMAASNHRTALPALIAARRLGLPFIYEMRGFWELTQLARNRGFARTAAFRNAVALESLTAAEADLVFAQTQAMQDELVRRGVTPGRIRLLPNACDLDRFAPAPRDGALAAGLDLPEAVPVIGYVGSFTGYEGLDDLILACAGLMRRGLDFRLLLVGDEFLHHPDQVPITPRLQALIRRTGIGDRVRMPGRIAPGEVPRWYSLIDIAPLPRKPLAVTELVAPLKPLEAMAMGKTVIASDVAALAETVRHERTGLLFARGDVAALEAALARALTEPALRARLGAAGRAWVQAERSWTGMAEQVRAAVSDLAGQGRQD